MIFSFLLLVLVFATSTKTVTVPSTREDIYRYATVDGMEWNRMELSMIEYQ